MRLPFILLVSLLLGDVALAGAPVVHMTVGTTTYEGRILAADKFTCWLAEPTGAYRRLSLGDVASFGNRPGEFKPLTAAQLRDQLLHDLDGQLEIEVVGSYLVCAGSGRARAYGTILDSTARAFQGYAGRRQLPVKKLEFPLVAIVFPTWDQFRRYAEGEGLKPTPTLRGYYNPQTNRIALYEGEATATTLAPPAAVTSELFALRPAEGNALDRVLTLDLPAVPPAPLARFAALSGADLKGTLIHEAIHQLAFNTGLHSRFGEEPRWLVEGFAMLLESESHLRDERSANPGDRVDLDRYLAFQQGLPKRPKTTMTSLIGTDDLFMAAPLNAYAESWALSFFLMETRSARYADYLKRLARRDRLSAYSTADRLKDFREAFSTDLPMMDSQLLRYMAELKVRTKPTTTPRQAVRP